MVRKTIFATIFIHFLTIYFSNLSEKSALNKFSIYKWIKW